MFRFTCTLEQPAQSVFKWPARIVVEEGRTVKRAALPWLIFVLIALGSFYEAAKLPFGRMNAPGAGFFPVVLAALLGAVSLAGLIAAFRDGGERQSHESHLFWKKIILTVTALAAFAVIFERVGYLVTTFLFVAFLLRIVERRSRALAAAVAFAASLVSYLIFGLLLGAPLPAGVLPV
jgi:putative tricarboxylic transport membrane protein